MEKKITEKINLDALCINTIRFLSVDAVQKADSGHPGLPMEAAGIGHLLFTKFLKYNPRNPKWPNRDRFILSAGHGCMLLYSLLHLTGYDLSLEEIKNFRQWGSKTPGHPEYGHTPGVEVTTGPLGQGFSNGVGMGIALRFLSRRFNRPGFPLVDYFIYVICSDGDLMEGISHEAASLAGHLKLGNLIYIYLDNHVTIEGNTSLAYSDEVKKRFESYHWHVEQIDGNNLEQIGAALEAGRNMKDQPTLIIARTHIGYGSPHKQDSAEAHGSPLGVEEVKLTKENLHWPLSPEFYIPNEVLSYYQLMIQKGEKAENEWNELFRKYQENFPQLAAEFQQFLRGELPKDWKKVLPVFSSKDGTMATRQASGKTVNLLAPVLPYLLGGSADLAPSNDTMMKEYLDFLPENEQGRNLHFGVREHNMAGALNGIAATGGFIPYGGTFLTFLDYLKPSLRLAALMKLRVIYVFTHDSIGLGEDGPTHQPVEQLATLRATPNVIEIRPADANETSVAWRVAIEHQDGPVALVLTRQKLPILDRSVFAAADNVEKGAYILADSEGKPDLILMASGSEVSIAVDAWKQLKEKKVNVRLVSFPSFGLFKRQPREYRNTVFPASVRKRIAIEAASSFGWHEFVGEEGKMICLDRFGASAPYSVIYRQLNFTPDYVVTNALQMLSSDQAEGKITRE
jgi:transketolase